MTALELAASTVPSFEPRSLLLGLESEAQRTLAALSAVEGSGDVELYRARSGELHQAFARHLAEAVHRSFARLEPHYDAANALAGPEKIAWNNARREIRRSPIRPRLDVFVEGTCNLEAALDFAILDNVRTKLASGSPSLVRGEDAKLSLSALPVFELLVTDASFTRTRDAIDKNKTNDVSAFSSAIASSAMQAISRSMVDRFTLHQVERSAEYADRTVATSLLSRTSNPTVQALFRSRLTQMRGSKILNAEPRSFSQSAQAKLAALPVKTRHLLRIYTDNQILDAIEYVDLLRDSIPDFKDQSIVRRVHRDQVDTNEYYTPSREGIFVQLFTARAVKPSQFTLPF